MSRYTKQYNKHKKAINVCLKEILYESDKRSEQKQMLIDTLSEFIQIGATTSEMDYIKATDKYNKFLRKTARQLLNLEGTKWT